jgi:hypothetical protein
MKKLGLSVWTLFTHTKIHPTTKTARYLLLYSHKSAYKYEGSFLYSPFKLCI